jgi:uncharacterized OB-fold protein
MSAEEATVPRPAPPVTELSQGFWDAVARKTLAVQRCGACNTLRHYPQPLCPRCQSNAFDWAPVSGRGEIYSYTVAHRAFHPAWKDHVPYVIATIELDEGVRMVCDLLDVDPETVAIGQRVEVDFAELPGQGWMPRFKVVD